MNFIDTQETSTFEQLMNGEKPSCETEFYCKGKKLECSLVVLSLKEQGIVKGMAAKDTKKLLGEALPATKDEPELAWKSINSDRQVLHTLFHAMRQTRDITKYFWPNWTVIEDLCTGDEIAILFNKYLQFKMKSNKVLAEMNVEEANIALREMMKEGVKPEYFLDLCTQEVLKTLLLSLISQVKTLQTATTSSIEPQENSSNTEKTI